RQFILNLEQPLRAHNQTWAHAGFIWMSLGDSRKAIEWLSDWRNREGVEPWMLWNLALAFRKEDRDRESLEICRQAVTLQPDHMTQSHILFIAFDELLAGDLANATSRLEKINEPTLRDWDSQLLQLVRALERFQSARQQGVADHESTVSELFGQMRETESDVLISLGRRAIQFVTEDRDNAFFTLWVKARWLWVWLLKPDAKN
ncbi:MAG: hypothetical protein AAB401_09525, partial [Acidobacteriota bacterium]